MNGENPHISLDALQSLELDRIAPVPEATRRRGVKYVRAFRAWAYEGVAQAPKLAVICGLSASTIRHCRQEDGWREWMQGKQDREAAARYGIQAGSVQPILPAQGAEIAARESERRGKQAETLQSELRIIARQMADERDKGSKRYACLAANMRMCADMLDELLGIAPLAAARKAGAIARAKCEAEAATRGSEARKAGQDARLANLRASHGSQGGSTERAVNGDVVDVEAMLSAPAGASPPA